jgi:hypothetical protein
MGEFSLNLINVDEDVFFAVAKKQKTPFTLASLLIVAFFSDYDYD